MYDFTLVGHTYQLTQAEQTLLDTHPPTSKADWNKDRYYDYKQNVKHSLILRQLDRCAYCRKLLEADGKYEPLDHIVPQSIQGTWIFKVRNLILTCDSCNNLKKKEQTLADGYEDSPDLPTVTQGYKIFNPHYDLWSEHLNYENDIFIVAVPDSKGKETIRICQLYRYNVILNQAKERKIGQKEPTLRIMHRLRGMNVADPEYPHLKDHLLLALNHFVERMEDDARFQ